MAFVVFENSGEIDPLTIQTFGMSVKETEHPLGFFGTGLKYALAILLRTGHRVMLQSGRSTHEFTLAERTIRGTPFRLVAMDGQPLGFTDQLGKTWEVWMAYRELTAMSEPLPEIVVCKRCRVTVKRANLAVSTCLSRDCPINHLREQARAEKASTPKYDPPTILSAG